jgi:hypothetical protein
VDSPRSDRRHLTPYFALTSPSQTCPGGTFIVAFPAGCPFLTAVGSVSGIPPSETAASFSSGGFSNVFAQPSYQTSAVATYLTALGTTNAGKFNKTGRAYPDVSTQGGLYSPTMTPLFLMRGCSRLRNRQWWRDRRCRWYLLLLVSVILVPAQSTPDNPVPGPPSPASSA